MRVARLVVGVAVAAAFALFFWLCIQEHDAIPPTSEPSEVGAAARLADALPDVGASASASRTEGGGDPRSSGSFVPLSGRVRYSSGRAVSSRLTIVPRSHVYGAASIEVLSAQDGTYKALVPAQWLDVVVRAADSFGGRGEAEASGSGPDVRVPDIIMTRPITLRLKLAWDPRVALAVPHGIAGTLHVALGRNQRQSFADFNDKVVASFGLGMAAAQQIEEVVDCAEHDALKWMFHHHSGGNPSMAMTSEIPAFADTVNSVYTIDLDALIMAVVLDEHGSPAPGVPLIIWVDSGERQRFEACTDASGHCIRVVPRGAYGHVQVKWENNKATWSAGQFTSIECRLKDRLRIKVVSSDGSPVEMCRLSLHNDPLRGSDGRISNTRPMTIAPNGVQCTEWTTLEEGTILYASLPNVGEIATRLTHTIGATDGVYVLKLPPPEHGSLRFVLRRSGSENPSGVVGIHLIEDGVGKNRREYRLSFRVKDPESGYTAHQLLPGRYSYSITVSGKDIKIGTIVVSHGVTSDIVIDAL